MNESTIRNARFNHPTTRRFSRPLIAALSTFVLVAGAPNAMAGSAETQRQRPAVAPPLRQATVLPPQAQPYGYSLADMAELLAAFNVGDRSGPPPNTPFQILYMNTVTGATAFDVAPGKTLYVPLLYNDDSQPIIGRFPDRARNRQQTLQYWYSQGQLGVTTMELVIDGKVVTLGGTYVSGIDLSAPLPDGAVRYMTAGAFISPLPRGVHTVEIRSKATGDALREAPILPYFPEGYFEFSTVYTVNVH
jgi:hypothetical protein